MTHRIGTLARLFFLANLSAAVSWDHQAPSPLQKLRLQLAALRSRQKGEQPDGTPIGGDLRGPRRSDGYPMLVVEALRYAWTWQGNALRTDDE